MKSLKTIIGICAGAMLSLAIAESVNLLLSYQFYTYTEPHKEIGFVGIPNEEWIFKTNETEQKINFNSKGLRDDEHSYFKSKPRILILGDSYSAGYEMGIEDTYAQLLEKNSKYEVINSAVWSYNTELEKNFLKYEGYKYNPDIIILQFSLEDIFENDRDFRYSYLENKLWQCSNHLQTCAIVLRNIRKLDDKPKLNPIKTKKLIQEIKDISDNMNARLIVLVNSEIYPKNSEYEKLLEGIEFVDFSRLDRKEYYTVTKHWNAKAHFEVAKELSSMV